MLVPRSTWAVRRCFPVSGSRVHEIEGRLLKWVFVAQHSAWLLNQLDTRFRCLNLGSFSNYSIGGDVFISNRATTLKTEMKTKPVSRRMHSLNKFDNTAPLHSCPGDSLASGVELSSRWTTSSLTPICRLQMWLSLAWPRRAHVI